jgi:hypothetical protein
MNTRKLYSFGEHQILDCPNSGLRYLLNNQMVIKTTEPVENLEEASFDTLTQSLVNNAIHNFSPAMEDGSISVTPGAVSDIDKLYLIREIVEEKMEDFDGPGGE